MDNHFNCGPSYRNGNSPKNLCPSLKSQLGLKKVINSAKYILTHCTPSLLWRSNIPHIWGSTLSPNLSQPLPYNSSILVYFPKPLTCLQVTQESGESRLNMLPHLSDIFVFHWGIVEKDLSQRSHYHCHNFRHLNSMLLRVMVDSGKRHFFNKRAFLHLTNYTPVPNISFSVALGQVWLLQLPLLAVLASCTCLNWGTCYIYYIFLFVCWSSQVKVTWPRVNNQ